MTWPASAIRSFFFPPPHTKDKRLTAYKVFWQMDKLGLPGLPLRSGKLFQVKISESLRCLEQEAACELSFLPHVDGWMDGEGRELPKTAWPRSFRLPTWSFCRWAVQRRRTGCCVGAVLDGTHSEQRTSAWLPDGPFVFCEAPHKNRQAKSSFEVLRQILGEIHTAAVMEHCIWITLAACLG